MGRKSVKFKVEELKFRSKLRNPPPEEKNVFVFAKAECYCCNQRDRFLVEKSSDASAWVGAKYSPVKATGTKCWSGC